MKQKENVMFDVDFELAEVLNEFSSTDETGEHVLSGIISEHEIDSYILGEQRKIQIYLPADYFEDTGYYKVLYLQDGNNMFFSETAYGAQHWRMGETLDRLIAEGRMEPVIAVGVFNSENRDDEYTFCYDADEESGGLADMYLSFLIKEVMPFVERNYRAELGREHTGILGSSLGGLLALYAGYRYNEFFSVIGAVSPSIWWGNCEILNVIAEIPANPLRIWLDMGTSEGEEVDEFEGVTDSLYSARIARETLELSGLEEGEDFFYHEAPDADHTEADWAARLSDILETLYPPELF